MQWIAAAGVAYALSAMVLVWPARAQSDPASGMPTGLPAQVMRVQDDVADLRVAVATLSAHQAVVRSELVTLRAGQDNISDQISRALWGTVALLGSIVLGLLAAMWSIRRGWLTIAGESKPQVSLE
jgi:hypothetical protein